ncbi:MAG TPA: AbrB/MazE/SpoVT family DNA-binding domain-containing protein [Longimicrobiales bacterium]|nr:AbrB/MazE/SpoVT family DNA-binding domain-containing protein [Longimicrobiales bacterium]
MASSRIEDGGGSPPRRARLFWNGRSQAVRLPKEFRFAGEAVEIRREGSAVILEPVRAKDWPDGFWDWVAGNGEGMEIGDAVGLGASLLAVELDGE